MAKSDYIYKANTIYSDLKEMNDFFYMESQVINYVKCLLLRNEEIEDFNVAGIDVLVYSTDSGYELCFDDYVIEIEVCDKQIVNFEVRK